VLGTEAYGLIAFFAALLVIRVTLRRFLTEEDATIVRSHRATSYFSVALATPLQWPVAHWATEDDYG
jgi:hypothetical protein